MIDFSPKTKLSAKFLSSIKKNKDWYGKSFPGFLIGLYLQGADAGVYLLRKSFPWAYKMGTCFFVDSTGTWFWDYGDIKRVRRIILGKIKKNPKYFNSVFDKWQKRYQAYDKVIAWADKRDLSKLDSDGLADLYKKVYQACIDQAQIAYITEAFLSSGEGEWLVCEIRKRWPKIAQRKDFIKIIQTFYQITLSSFIQEETTDALKIAQRIYQKHRNLDRKTLLPALQTHAKKYYWLENNYHTCKVLKPEYFYKKIKETVGQESPGKVMNKIKGGFARAKKDKARLLSKLNANKELRALVRLVDQLARLQDYRKKAVLTSNHYLFAVAEKISLAHKIPFHDALFLTGPEVLEALSGRVDKKTLKKRHQGCVFIVTAEGTHLFTGQEFKKLYGPPFFVKLGKVNRIKGTCASPGQACGRVKIISKQKDFAAMKKGMILVANNTTPDYVPAMKKAAAIITEQGGLTAHAAIVSRELGVPCVIGTKIATQVLKDGDRVEVR